MKVIVYGQSATDYSCQIIKKVIRFLVEHQAEVYVESTFYDLIPNLNQEFNSLKKFEPHHKVDASFDYFISLGGDGTVLRSVTFVGDSGVPIFAINTGRLGFLANIQPETILHSLQQLIEKEYVLSARTLLELECVPNKNEFLEINFALNEVTVSRKDTTSMITIETYLNDEYLTSYWADGLIIATPTGSTGYSLSCGGPVLTPEVSSLVVNPIAPHNLNARPLVIPDETHIKLKVSGRENQFLVSLDSRIAIIDQETELIIKKKPFKINMITLQNESFLRTLRNKLLWGEDKRN